MPAIPGGRGPTLVTEFAQPTRLLADAPQTAILAPTEGAVVLTGNIPALVLILAAVVGAVALSGNTPAVAQTLAPSSGAVVLGGNAPSVSQALVLSPAEGQIVLAGAAPSLSVGFSPAVGAVVLGGNAPALQAVLGPPEGAIQIAGNVPDVVVVAPVAVGAAFYTGGFGNYDYPIDRRTPEDIRKARARFGICDDRVPIKVCKVIAQVAAHKIDEPDLALDAALHRALERKALAYRAYYAEVLRQEIARLQQQEDEEIVVLLLM